MLLEPPDWQVLHKWRTLAKTTWCELVSLEDVCLFPAFCWDEDQTRRSVDDEAHRLSTSSLECVVCNKQKQYTIIIIIKNSFVLSSAVYCDYIITVNADLCVNQMLQVCIWWDRGLCVEANELACSKWLTHGLRVFCIAEYRDALSWLELTFETCTTLV